MSLVDQFIDQIDWRSLRRRYPQVWNILPLLHYVTPWSEKVIARLDFDLRHEPAGVAQPYSGWPRTCWRPKNAKWNRRLLGNTFNPPEWWLRWYYGTGARSPGFGCGGCAIRCTSWNGAYIFGKRRYAGMDLDDKPRQKTDYRLEQLDDELLLYHPVETGILYLNPTASLIWGLCNGERIVQEIITLLQEAYPEAGVEIAEDVHATLDQFVESGCIELA